MIRIVVEISVDDRYELKTLEFEMSAELELPAMGFLRLRIQATSSCIAEVYGEVPQAPSNIRRPLAQMAILPHTVMQGDLGCDWVTAERRMLVFRALPAPPAPDSNRDLIDALGAQLQDVSDHYKRDFKELEPSERDRVLRAAAEEMIESIEYKEEPYAED